MAIQHQMNILNFIHNEENGKIIIVRCRFLHPRIVQIPKVWNTLCWPECGRAKRPRLHRRWGREQVWPSRKARWHRRSQLVSLRPETRLLGKVSDGHMWTWLHRSAQNYFNGKRLEMIKNNPPIRDSSSWLRHSSAPDHHAATWPTKRGSSRSTSVGGSPAHIATWGQKEKNPRWKSICIHYTDFCVRTTDPH